MAKWLILFKGLDPRGNTPEPEEVSADSVVDRAPFVDFYANDPSGGAAKLVARYRQDDIRRVTRED